MAAREGQLEVAKEHLNNGVDVNGKDKVSVIVLKFLYYLGVLLYHTVLVIPACLWWFVYIFLDTYYQEFIIYRESI